MDKTEEARCDVLNVKRGWDRWSGSTVELCGPPRGSALSLSLHHCTCLLSQARTLEIDLQLAVLDPCWGLPCSGTRTIRLVSPGVVLDSKVIKSVTLLSNSSGISWINIVQEKNTGAILSCSYRLETRTGPSSFGWLGCCLTHRSTHVHCKRLWPGRPGTLSAFRDSTGTQGVPQST